VIVCGEAARRARKGVIRVRVAMNVEREELVEVRVSGDFFAYPEDVVWKLEEALKGAPITEVLARITAALKEAELVGCSPSDFAETIIEAIKRAGGGV
jgi:lipoate-protein ligase A